MHLFVVDTENGPNYLGRKTRTNRSVTWKFAQGRSTNSALFSTYSSHFELVQGREDWGGGQGRVTPRYRAVFTGYCQRQQSVIFTGSTVSRGDREMGFAREKRLEKLPNREKTVRFGV